VGPIPAAEKFSTRIIDPQGAPLQTQSFQFGEHGWSQEGVDKSPETGGVGGQKGKRGSSGSGRIRADQQPGAGAMDSSGDPSL
jgi:hypothetical protein